MSDLSALKTIFSRYAGKPIKDPQRLTCDCDEVVESLAQEVRQAGYMMGGLYEKDMPAAGCMVFPNIVTSEFERDGSGRLRLTGNFKLGN